MAKSLPSSEPETDKEKRRKRSLANLEKNKIRKGEVRNPTGKNGRTRAEYVASWLETQDPEDPEGRIRIDIVLQREYEHTEQRPEACKALREAYAGKPRQSVDLSSEDGSMSPNGPDSVSEGLRAAIAARRRAEEQPTPEATVTDEAGSK